MTSLVDLTPAAIVDGDATPAGEVRAQFQIVAANLKAVSEVGDAVAHTGMTCTVTRANDIATLSFHFDATPITWTDAAGSGASGSLKLFDFAPGDIIPLGSRSAFSWLGDDLIDGNAGDLAFVYALGSVAANAGDAALTGTEVDFGAVSGTITLSSKAATSQVSKAVGTLVNGTSADADLYLNVSGSAATSEANGVLTVSGTLTVVVALLGKGANT